MRLSILPESQQLARDNWLEWKRRILAICGPKCLVGHLDGTKTWPNYPTPLIDEWEDRDELAKSTITLNIRDLIGSSVDLDETAHEIWTKLTQIRENRRKQPATWKHAPRAKQGSPADLAARAKGGSMNAANNASANLTSASTSHHPTLFYDYNIFLANAFITAGSICGSLNCAFIDSGVTHHYFRDRTNIVDYLPITPIVGNTAKEGSTFTMVGVGTVRIQVEINGLKSIVTFQNAMHAPDLSANLISLSRIDRSGGAAIVENGILKIVGDGRSILEGRLTDGDLYEVHFQHVDLPILSTLPEVHIAYDPRAVAFSAVTSGGPVSIATWHHRLGHASERTIRAMASQQVVDGLILTDEKPLGKCEDCLKGKMSAAPFHESQVEEEVLERVYIDLMGPFQAKSLGSAEYVLTIDDDASSYSSIYLLKGKSAEETLKHFQDFHHMAEHQTEYKLKCVCSDNGGEFMNATWDKYLLKHSIIYESTTPYTPQQNGLGEHGHRTLAKHARAMLFDAGVPNYLWGEAFITAAYVKNLTASSCQCGLTPYEKWFKHKPNISHLHAFGSIAYAKLADETRFKLDPKSVKCILVGYTGDANYRLWDPMSGPHGTTFCSHKVVFEEGPGHRSINEEGVVNIDLPNIERRVPAPLPIPPPVDHVPAVDDPHVGRDPADIPMEHLPEHLPAHPIPQALKPHCSARTHIPTCALQESQESEAREQAAHVRGEAWADNSIALNHDCVGAYMAMLIQGEKQKPTAFVHEGGVTPSTYKEAGQHADIWQPAMQTEIDGLHKIGAWQLLPRTAGMNVVGCKWVYARKFDETGKWKAKARLIAKGFQQILGIDYFETHASVIHFESLWMICAIATFNDMEMGQDDVEKAYLNATPQEMIYMEQPPGFVDAEFPDHVCLMQRSLYGFMQSGNDWCVRARQDDNGVMVTATYTDDISSCTDTVDGLGRIRGEIGTRYHLSGGGDFKYMLGVIIKRDRDVRTMRISQHPYAERVLKRFSIQYANPVHTPLEPSIKLGLATEPITSDEALEMATVPYREALGTIMYLAVTTRPDLSYPVQVLSRYMANPGIIHWKALKCVLRYIKGTLDYGITFCGPPHPLSTLQPTIYSDSSHADCPDTARSTHGYVAVMASAPVSWSSHRQDVVTLSTTEAEYIAAVHAGQTAMWIAKFMDNIHNPVTLPVNIRMDSSGGESLAKRSANFTRVRHLHGRYHWLRDAIRLKEIDIIHIPGADNPADIFTKSLSQPVLHKHLLFLGVAA
ncbi:hypothetical protein SCP_0204530 [Sparassis crispa]|uniref:Integrase catalytic domain-containing protein n=1 Tax=Sparassis crispa TaxID=139825 RepID=A0A401GAR7_9APHY|nr:hypothetical protein SCP_0204530 [Sparassis crispa]GBE79255.1 hypothetical protein SCP_0204530 [Sparassis crispa]